MLPPLSRADWERQREKERRKRKEGQEKTKEKGARAREGRHGPSIKLAPLPAGGRQPLRPKTAEPAPQKPDIKLPADAIRASKAGTKPLSEHLRKHEQRRLAAQGDKTSPAGAAEAAPAAAGDRGRCRAENGLAAAARPVPPKRGRGQAATLGGREQRQLKRKKAATARRRKPEEEGEEGVRAGRCGDERTSAGRAPTRPRRGAKT